MVLQALLVKVSLDPFSHTPCYTEDTLAGQVASAWDGPLRNVILPGTRICALIRWTPAQSLKVG